MDSKRTFSDIAQLAILGSFYTKPLGVSKSDFYIVNRWVQYIQLHALFLSIESLPFASNTMQTDALVTMQPHIYVKIKLAVTRP